MRFVHIRVRSTPFKVVGGEDNIEVPHKQPGKTNIIDTRKDLPQELLGGQKLGVIYHSEDPRAFSG